MTAPFLAAYYGREDLIVPWLQGGGDPNATDAYGRSVLQFATGEHGRFEVVSKLLEYGADPNRVESVDDGTPLMRAAEFSSFGTFVLLLEFGADPNVVSVGTLSVQKILESGDVIHRAEKLEFLRNFRERKDNN